MSYVPPYKIKTLSNSEFLFTCINDSTDISTLLPDVKHLCIYTYRGYPNLEYLDSIKDKVFIVAIVDTELYSGVNDIPLKFNYDFINVDNPETFSSYNDFLAKYDKPKYLHSRDKVTAEKIKDWYYANLRLLNSSKFKIQTFGSLLGNDLDLLITKKTKVSIKEVSKFLNRLIISGKVHGITVEPFFCNDKDYFETFYYEDNKIEEKPVLMGWYSDKDYPAKGKKLYKDKLNLMYYPWKELFFQSCHKDEAKKLITKYTELESIEGGVHISPSIYYSVFSRYGNLKTLNGYGSNF